MLPIITPEFTLEKIYSEFLQELRGTSFSGEIHIDFAARLSVATDNSIYQNIPQAVIFPRITQDIAILLHEANQERYHSIQFCPRGGGTSTNGQSLTSGIIIDCSKHMREILELNLVQNYVRVQSGVVLDQLNAYLKPYDVCFAPEISPSNRATIGGMINTDACGVGSLVLGRTSDHVMDLTCVLSTGRIVQTGMMKDYQQRVTDLITPHRKLISEKFTSAPRTLNGYNLKKGNNLNYLICGSEGTLAVVAECKLKLTPIPNYKQVIVVKYRNFDDALRSHGMTYDAQPLIIEAIDEKLIDLARRDSMYFFIKDFIEQTGSHTGAVNLVEFVAHNKNELEEKVKRFESNLRNIPSVLGYYLAQNATEEKYIWDLRKKSVGLISKKLTGTRRPIPFIEDTAVPPEKLADYISEFKALLDQHQLTYGMYGHVDAGCMHVRPALDMKINADEKLMQELSDKVVALVKKYGGVLWGEHGQGHRCVYGEEFFGSELYEVVRQIKTLFDPYNQLNPGKIAVSKQTHGKLVALNGPLRGTYDKQIPESWRENYSASIACNGNGACFNYASAEIMCPSYKATKDRIQSPKGRSVLMREWLRQLANKKVSLENLSSYFFQRKVFNKNEPDFSEEVYQAMTGCLSCKGCTGQCPLNVDVPDFKAKFLFYYHTRYFRPLRDYFIASFEIFAPFQAHLAGITNWILQRKLTRWFFSKVFKLVDLPLLSSLSLKQEFQKRHIPVFNLDQLKKLSAEQKQKTVILLQDALTSFYQPQVLLAAYDFLVQIGYMVYIAPYFASGKPMHVKGFLPRFKRLAKKNHKYLEKLSALDIPIIGLDPSITLMYRDEYPKILGLPFVKIYLLQEWLKQQTLKPIKAINKSYYLIVHCTEKSLCVESEKQWQSVFSHFGLTLTPLSAGCCGMAGSYGHEKEHKQISEDLFNMDWKRYLLDNDKIILSTGYSCRSQAERLTGKRLMHPVEILGLGD